MRDEVFCCEVINCNMFLNIINVIQQLSLTHHESIMTKNRLKRVKEVG